nr:formate dehydrogenase accessory sulfurtransferase FdhD [uncultured Methanospirillum sp.]
MSSQDGGIPGVTVMYSVVKVSGGTERQTSVEVCTESRVILFLNDVIIGDLSITPVELEAFAVGHLICEGYISRVEEIRSITISLPEIRITTPGPECTPLGQFCKKKAFSPVLPGAPNGAPLGFSKNSSGGSCRDLLPDGSLPPLPDGLSLDVDTIMSSMEKVNDYSVIWKRTGGMHCSLIIRDDGEVICGVEDMGRHTTVDKAVGVALQKGVDISRCYLVCSGRLPVDMVAKAYRAGIPVVVSNNAAFAGGIEFAKKTNMTLAGFVRPPNMTIYAGGHRIRSASQ